MAFSINDIRSRLKFGGARPTLFNVQLTAPSGVGGDLSDSEFMIQASSLPGSTISPIEIPYFGRKIKVAGDREFEPWSVTVMNDEDFKIRQVIENWHNRINSLSGNLNTLGSAAPTNYKSQAIIRQFSKSGGPAIREYCFYGMFPVEVSPIEVSWEAQNQIETFSVTWVYDWYEVVRGNTGRLA
jgi:hypothetical protein